MANDKRVEHLTSEKTEFKREIGVFGGVSIIGGIMIGSGIFYIGAYVLQRTGMDSGLSLICWILAGIISLFGGLCYAELGTAKMCIRDSLKTAEDTSPLTLEEIMLRTEGRTLDETAL